MPQTDPRDAQIAALRDLLERAPIDHFRWCNGDNDCECSSRGWLDERKRLLEGKQ